MPDSDSFFGPTSTDAELLRALTLARKQHAHMSGPFRDDAPRSQFDAAVKEMLALEAEAQSRGVRKNPTARERAALEMLLAEHEGRVAKRNYAAKKPAAKKPAAKKPAAKKPAAKKPAAKKPAAKKPAAKSSKSKVGSTVHQVGKVVYYSDSRGGLRQAGDLVRGILEGEIRKQDLTPEERFAVKKQEQVYVSGK